ncbi:uroporphyrinogen decarboxylase [Microlunatus endophyticus]|uniref:uroporphyrinogen decarboxylase n=1 Tax=Microlunatus endophyticus TaxID=1716077 RepID=UPI001E536777|nr:uroporphyrinogen decarboxylase [Microlunatus endophyticus]
MPAPQTDPAVPAPQTGEPALLAAARRRQSDAAEGNRLPVWFMRQAGRSLPEYHKVRAGLGMLETCARPELVTEITLQPVRRYGVDGAVLYSDIMAPLQAAGIGLDIKPGVGPVIDEPIRDRAGLDRLRPLDPASVEHVAEAVRLLVAELGTTPLIGFAGAPFTLASYLVEGGPSKDYARTKALMVGDPALWHDLCERLADIAADFLAVQIGAGARIVQLFDSWVGSLSLADYRVSVAEHSARVLARARELGVPTIHFGVGTGELLPAMADAGADVVGVDWRIPLAEASRRIGPDHAVQGNLDPALLGAPWPVVADRVRSVIRSGAQAPGHIFNLGHGVPPTTDPDVLAKIVDLVHAEGPALRSEVTR